MIYKTFGYYYIVIPLHGAVRLRLRISRCNSATGVVYILLKRYNQLNDEDTLVEAAMANIDDEYAALVRDSALAVA